MGRFPVWVRDNLYHNREPSRIKRASRPVLVFKQSVQHRMSIPPQLVLVLVLVFVCVLVFDALLTEHDLTKLGSTSIADRMRTLPMHVIRHDHRRDVIAVAGIGSCEHKACNCLLSNRIRALIEIASER